MSRSSPPSMSDRARLGGLSVMARHGPEHMSAIGRTGQSALDRRIAAEAGLDPLAADYEARLAAARRIYFTRLRRGAMRQETPE